MMQEHADYRHSAATSKIIQVSFTVRFWFRVFAPLLPCFPQNCI